MKSEFDVCNNRRSCSDLTLNCCPFVLFRRDGYESLIYKVVQGSENVTLDNVITLAGGAENLCLIKTREDGILYNRCVADLLKLSCISTGGQALCTRFSLSKKVA